MIRRRRRWSGGSQAEQSVSARSQREARAMVRRWRQMHTSGQVKESCENWNGRERLNENRSKEARAGGDEMGGQGESGRRQGGLRRKQRGA